MNRYSPLSFNVFWMLNPGYEEFCCHSSLFSWIVLLSYTCKHQTVADFVPDVLFWMAVPDPLYRGKTFYHVVFKSGCYLF